MISDPPSGRSCCKMDTYGHLIPGANVCFVDRLDGRGAEEAKTSNAPIRNSRATRGDGSPTHRTSCKLLKRLVAAVGLEPTTYGL
jgi:hypothetical protein